MPLVLIICLLAVKLNSYEADSLRAEDKDRHYATLCQHVTNIGNVKMAHGQ